MLLLPAYTLLLLSSMFHICSVVILTTSMTSWALTSSEASSLSDVSDSGSDIEKDAPLALNTKGNTDWSCGDDSGHCGVQPVTASAINEQCTTVRFGSVCPPTPAIVTSSITSTDASEQAFSLTCPKPQVTRATYRCAAPWWLKAMQHSFRQVLGVSRLPLPERPMIHESIFSGTVAELAASIDLGLWQRTLVACDPKTSAQTFARNNFREICEHYFESIDNSMARRGLCAMHLGKTCQAPSLPVDCLSSGSPCQAWATTRDKTKTGTRTSSIVDHPDWKRTFDDFFNYVDGRSVKGGYCEQTKGFGHKTVGIPGFRTPLACFVSKLKQRDFNVVVIEENNSSVWCECPRDRRSSVRYTYRYDSMLHVFVFVL